MNRTGISITMSYVVIGLIMLATAATVILYFTGNMDVLREITGSEFDQNKKSLARSHCLTEKERLCNSRDYSDDLDGWAEDATYDGKSCRQLAQDQNLFGAGGASDIPECE